MTPPVPAPARVAAGKARELLARLRPGALEARRSLPVRRPGADVLALWADPQARAAILDGIPVADASLEVSEAQDAWGTTVSLRIQLSGPVPGIAARALAGKAVRRLKALAETGEVPTTDHNPSARADAGEPAS